MTYTIHTRSQHAKKGRRGFSGPDTYVAVTIMPAGVALPGYALRRDLIERRGGRLIHFGEGYRKHSGPKSQLGQAMAAARAFVSQQEASR